MSEKEIQVGDRVKIKRERIPNSNWDACVGKVVSIARFGSIKIVRVYNPNFQSDDSEDSTWGFSQDSVEKF
ncbi:hypothetical protein Mithridates_00175 [Acinetobacter phage Mithridates]|nr:hypothetical protein Mithridates_00175 [Acinetobacter phage Mithridates]